MQYLSKVEAAVKNMAEKVRVRRSSGLASLRTLHWHSSFGDEWFFLFCFLRSMEGCRGLER